MSYEERILAISYAMELLTLFSIVMAALVLWRNRQIKREERLKDSKPPGSRLGNVIDEHKRD